MSTVYVKSEFKRKKINPFFRIIFSRFFIIIGLIILQILLLYYFGRVLLEGPISVVISILNVIIAVLIVNRSNQKVEYKLIWIILIGLVPGMGVFLYILLYINKLFGINKKRLKKNIKETSNYLNVEENYIIDKLDNKELQFYKLMVGSNMFIAHQGNDIRYLKDGNEYFDTVLEELKKAKEIILIEYFIISNGKTWQRILNVLIEKAREGVKVYVMYDGLNSIFSFSASYFINLHQVGIESKMFAPIIPFITYSQNSRDHRKVVIIDNKVAITGGINIGDEYANIISRFGHWKDCGIIIKGDAAISFTAQYLQIYNLSIRESKKLSIKDCMTINNPYINTKVNHKELISDSYIVSITDFPWVAHNHHEKLYKTLINNAEREVFITTPYLIIDSSMLDTIKIAQERGIHITFIVPHIPDKAYAFILTRSYFLDLLNYGCDVYEYTPGFIHQKVCVADNNRAYVGTCNFDYRSLFLHYENGVYIYNDKCIKDIKEDILDIISKSQKITINDVKHFNEIQKVFGPILKIFAPLM